MKCLMHKIALVLYCVVTWCSCKNSDSDKLFKKLDPGKTGIRFSNNLVYSDSLTVLDFEYMFNGGGVACIDINNDSLQDIILGGNMVASRLFLNKGQMRFEDITEQSGLTTKGWVNGISVVDINQDGFKDFYVSKAGNRKTPPSKMHNEFYINNGNNTFTESASKMGLDEDGYDIHSAFFDYDKDGDLDMYLLRNAIVNYNRNNSRQKETTGKAASTDKLFRNNGNGTFTNVSAEAGITIEGFGLGVTICDINNDNWPDVYVSNDFLTNDLLWINNQDGTFSNQAAQYMRHQTFNGMGNDVADFNNDGLEDVMVVDMLPPDNKRWKLTMMGNTFDEFQQNLNNNYEPQYVRNTLQLNNGNGSFSEIGQLSGVHATEWSWAPLFADFDNDGWKDIFISNGYRQDITNLDFIMYGKTALFMGTAEANRAERLKELKKLPGINVHNYAYKNNADLTFSDMSDNWGLKDEDYSNGAIYADLDNDGDLDLVINNLDQPCAVYENQSTSLYPDNNWLRIGFKGPNGNRDGFGAKVWIWQSGSVQYNYNTPYRGYLSSIEPILHFGLQKKKLDSLKILWPDGSIQIIKDIHSNKIYTLNYDEASKNNTGSYNVTLPAFFSPINKAAGIAYRHEEDDFVDFKVQPLLPHMHSREGPPLAVGDVNNDGLEDFYIGAASGSRASIFLQNQNGSFNQRQVTDSNSADNMGSIFFDADNDGDIDLYVAAGGSSTQKKENTIYRHSLYINDGNGNFTSLKEGMPDVKTPASGVTGADYDRDGDIDLFVCGRVSPGEFPKPGKSFLLRNDSKDSTCVFTDVTKANDPALTNPGMVTSALWSDYNNDGWVDLILVGEFMPLRFFQNTNGKLREATQQTSLVHTNGWWNSITGADFDKDGDIDYILGNLGLNGPYKASPEYPVCVYGGDYDKNGRLDPVMCHFIDGKEYMVHSRDDMNRQITQMRGRFRTYETYASVTFKDGFREDEIAEALVVKAERFESSYLENKGGGKFLIHALPLGAQFAPIYGMATGDFNTDGNMDVLTVGNSFSAEVQTGRYDARGSLLLLGDGQGRFKVSQAGINDNMDNKSIATINLAKGNSAMIIGSNSDSLNLYRINQKQKTVKITSDDTYALVTDGSNKVYRHEFYYGNSFLSQGSRSFVIPEGTRKIAIFNQKGNKREIAF